jgi:hypothetical protein
MVEALARKLSRWLQHRALPWHLAGLAVLLCAGSLTLGWQTDDYVHRAALTRPEGTEALARSPAELFAFVRGDQQANRAAIASGHLPWWAPLHLRLAFFRPVTGLTHWLDYRLWPDTPVLMHVHSLIWFGATVAAATIFYRRVFRGAWIAGLAALLFAVDDAHGLPAAWLANRNATIGTFFAVLTLIAHDRWRHDRWRPGAWLAPLALVLGLLSNETALATGGYLAAYALFLDRSEHTHRLASLAPYGVAAVLWAAAYKSLGYGAAGSGVYIDPAASPLQYLEAMVTRIPLLLFGQWFVASDLGLVLSQRATNVLWYVALGFLVLVGIGLAPIIRRDPLARFWLVGMLVAVLPPCSTFPSDRLLFLVGLGGMGLLTQLLGSVFAEPAVPTTARRRSVPVKALGVLLVVIHLVFAPLNLTQAARNVGRFGGVIAKAAASLPADEMVGDQTLLVLHCPTYFVSIYGPLIQTFRRKPTFPRIFILGSSIEALHVGRPDDRTLVIRPEGGFLAEPGAPPSGVNDQPPIDIRYAFPMFDLLFRDRTPMTRGQRVAMNGLTADVIEITADGRPAEVSFHFAKPLDSPEYRWVRWRDGAYVPFDPPAVGETATLPPLTVPM